MTFKFSYLDYSTMFHNSNVKKTVQFFLVSRDKEIITVKRLKSKKKAGTDFVLLC